MGDVRVAVAGLSFGRNFAAAFAAHPDVRHLGLCDVDAARLNREAESLGVSRRHTDLRQVIDSNDYDAVALFTPIPQHAVQVIDVLRSGKHCASAVPMATSLDDCRAIVAAVRQSRRNYMMMETSIADPQFLCVSEMHRRGEFGRLQYLRGVFYHNLENHPSYWNGIPPMWYTTHPVSPMLALAGTRAAAVACLGSGQMRPELHKEYGNPFPVQTAIFRLHDSDVAMHVGSVTFQTAVQPKEAFELYGEKQSFFWSAFRDDKHAIVRLHPFRKGGPKSSPTTVFRFDPPYVYDRVPSQMWHLGTHASVPVLVHEFVRSIVEGRKPMVDEIAAANWTAPGLCAHESALAGGGWIDVPGFE